ncbi:MAG TPA: DUF4139 domain-containing protein [candidate division Zixibacteria bacterium]|nr:DUF4139 domain-containing protein [candidate division Zixibacteria bacterium]MDD4918304.1 DUF4139 domain-containing protein [candidate division Zixibacteria bacterium]MDM7974010.1 DUF4139 domain-containing protein [candidate division Zixibacteria bacterium]HOD66774.1 DUF4139 domain-containing protein [candidate division Zixibacteria bacterium]HPC11469.1 DUF4139 domain-containing protein [candidate division Zixibacteria bacterium]
MARLVGIICVGVLTAAAAGAEEVAVTVYNSNLGVVSEVRDLSFVTGTGEVAFRDVPDQIDPASVRFELVGSRQGISILEQNYAYDLVSVDKIYSRYVDYDIEVLDKQGNLIGGTLLAAGQGAITLRDASGRVKVVLLENVTQVNFPTLPEGLITRPTLFWRYAAETGGSFPARVSYQTYGLSWEAEYVGVLSADEKTLDLSGWASITNNTSKTFADATLTLVAGDISRAPQAKAAGMARMDMLATAEAGFEEKAFFEYHLYTLPRPSTVAGKEVKQISLFEPARTAAEKRFVYRPEQNAQQVEVALQVVNAEQAGLGMPLPEGRVRVFQADADGSLILLGEDRINHTPRDEKIDIRVGYAFDIVPEEKLMNQTRVSQQVEERAYELQLRNRKDEPVTVHVEKALPGDWQVIAADFRYERKDARTLTFDVPVPARDTTTLNYTVRVKW